MTEDTPSSNLPVRVVEGELLPVLAGTPTPPALPPPSDGKGGPLPADAPKPKRKRSGTARWHMSSDAVDISLGDIYRMSARDSVDFLIEARWGSRKSMRCPHCGTMGPHRGVDRWRCCACHKTFSVTSKTVFADRKISLQDVIAGVLMWTNSSAGQPALELRRHWRTSYNTAYTLQHKIREALVRGYNVGLVSGDIEMDGSHQSGRRSVEKRGKPQVSQPATDDDDNRILDTQSERASERHQEKKQKKQKKQGAFHPEFATRSFHPDRRIVVSVRKRSNVKGRGAVETRVAVGLSEDLDTVQAVMGDFVACPESYLNVDESQTYYKLKKPFLGYRPVKHSKEFRGPNGESNNLAEELNARMDRAERGTYLNLEPKYLLDYAVEVAFRCDTRRMPNRAQLLLALHVALNVGESRFWRGFTHGRHRGLELTHPQPRPARSSGPAKGRHPISAANGRPPR